MTCFSNNMSAATFRCYYCVKSTNKEEEVIEHYLRNRSKKDFSVYKLFLDDATGDFIYRSRHFKIPVTSLEIGNKINIDYDAVKIKIKRSSEPEISSESSEQSSEQASSDSTSPEIKEIINVIPSVIEILNTIEPKMERTRTSYPC